MIAIAHSKAQNAFSTLARFGFDLYKMTVPDPLHDYDSGWKALLMHLIRILRAFDKAHRTSVETTFNAW
jgi:hypothetical protein